MQHRQGIAGSKGKACFVQICSILYLDLPGCDVSAHGQGKVGQHFSGMLLGSPSAPSLLLSLDPGKSVTGETIPYPLSTLWFLLRRFHELWARLVEGPGV